MDARHSAFRPDPEAIFTTVAERLTENTTLVMSESLKKGITSHEAARAIAQNRVREAMRLKGRTRGAA